MADLHSKLDELSDLLASAKTVPLSASCVVNRAEVVALIEEIRAVLPTELEAATGVLRERGDVVAEGRAEADRIIERAKADRARLVSRAEVAIEAERQAERILADARQQAATMRAEVEDYVDGKLANFEVVLHKTIAAVERGRDKLRGRVDHHLGEVVGGAHELYDRDEAADEDGDGHLSGPRPTPTGAATGRARSGAKA
jgi:F0F1-type ATP synthase membrane subunit b/b'